jgi:hypothetical protein
MDNDQILMQQLLKEFNCDESIIGRAIVSDFCTDKNSIDYLKKYDTKILTEINTKVSKYKDELFIELVRRRNNTGYDKGDIENMRCGFNVANDCVKKINNMIDKINEEQYQQRLDKLYKKQKNCVLLILKYIAAMFVIFIILLIFDYVCK